MPNPAVLSSCIASKNSFLNRVSPVKLFVSTRKPFGKIRTTLPCSSIWGSSTIVSKWSTKLSTSSRPSKGCRTNWPIIIRSWPISTCASSRWRRPSPNSRKLSISRNVWSFPMPAPPVGKNRPSGPGAAEVAGPGIPWSHCPCQIPAVSRFPRKTTAPSQSQRFPTRALLLPSKPCRFSASLNTQPSASRSIQPLQTMEPPMVVNYQDFATKALRDETLTRSECQAVLDTPDEQLLGLLQAAFTVRSRYFGKTVRLQMLQNAKSGACQEDCHY